MKKESQINMENAGSEVVQRERTEKKLRESEERFRTLFEFAPDAIYLTDLKGNFIDGNKTSEEIIGYDRHELIGKNFLKLKILAPRDIPRATALLVKNRLGLSSGPDEFSLTRRDGTQVVVEIRTHPMKILGKKVTLGIARDITERKRAEESMAARERKQAAVAELGQRALAGISLSQLFDDAVSQVAHVLDIEYCKVLELLPGGDSVFLTAGVGWREGLVGKAVIPTGKDSQAGYTLTSREPVVVKDLQTDSRFSGPRLLRDHDVVSGMSVIIGDLEKPWGILGAHTTKRRRFSTEDVYFLQAVANLLAEAIERRKSLDILRESEAKLNKISESVMDAIVMMDGDGRISYWNSAARRIFGWSAEEASGKILHELLAPKRFLAAYRKGIEKFTLTGEGPVLGRTIEFNALRKDGSEFPMELSLSNVKIGGRWNAVGVVRDVSERKQLEAQLRQSQKLESLGLLAGGVAHEINNPINGIMNYAQLLVDRPSNIANVMKFAGQIVRESERVAEIVKNLLSFARQDKQGRSPARMCDIVDATLGLIRTLVSNDHIVLKLNVPEDLPQISGRSQQIQQVIMNLVTNACDAINAKFKNSQDKKILSLSAHTIERDGQPWLRTTVADQGIGIPHEIRDKIFDPFFTSKGRNKGTGLGLSISHSIVQEHGGNLTVESEPGEYSRFHLDLPVLKVGVEESRALSK